MHFIINPVAARGAAFRDWKRIRDSLSAADIRFTEEFTSRAGEAELITRRAIAEGKRIIIAVGGDGTLSEVVNGCFDSSGAAIAGNSVIGLLPFGTGSDFRRSVGLMSIDDALNVLKDFGFRQIDIIKVQLRDDSGAIITRFAVNLVSFGLGGDAVRIVNSWRGSLPRWFKGRALFTAAALKALFLYRNHNVNLKFDDGRQSQLHTNFFLAANGRFAGGGMLFAPEAKLDDGLMDVILSDGLTRLDVIRELPQIQKGRHLENPKVSLVRSFSLEIDSDVRLAVDIDGEFAGFTPARLTVQPAALRFIAGRNSKAVFSH